MPLLIFATPILERTIDLLWLRFGLSCYQPTKTPPILKKDAVRRLLYKNKVVTLRYQNDVYYTTMAYLRYCLLLALTLMVSVVLSCSSAWKKQTSLTAEQQALADSGWVKIAPTPGDMPEHYGVHNKRALTHNSFLINLEPGMTAMAIKVMSADDSTCQRYIFAEAGTLTEVSQIRPGTYYLIMTHGRDWMELPATLTTSTKGKFTRDAYYERSAIDFTFPNATDTTQHLVIVRTHGKERTYNFPVGAVEEIDFVGGD